MINILFGSGADTCCSSRLMSGASFSKALFLDPYNKELKQLLGEDAINYKLVYPTSTKVFVQSIVENKSEAQKTFGDEIVKICEDYYYTHKNCDEVKEYCKKWYNNLKEDGGSDFFFKYAVFFDSLDAKFNSLRKKSTDKRARRVIGTYARIFIFMMKCVYDIPENFEWKYSNLFDFLTCESTKSVKTEKETYYSVVRKYNVDCNVITTNYTNLAEQLTGKQAIYLHGKLTWFEDLENLTVYDCCIEEQRELALSNESTLIPFILIPSGVKPLICKKEIKEFAKFIDALDQSKELCIVGYRMNSEDNHINSIVAEWLRIGDNRLIYFNYDRCIDFSQMRWAKNISRKDIIYGKDALDFSSGEKIINIIVDNKNSLSAFEEYLASCSGCKY